MAQQLGVTTPLKPFISMSIGSEEVRPIDMAGVYATFANDGVHHKPFLVDHVLDRNGKLILQGGDKGTQVLSPNKAHEELVALRAVVTGGTGVAAGLPDRQVGGQDGHGGEQRQRLVRRRHPAAHDRGVDGLADRQHPHVLGRAARPPAATTSTRAPCSAARTRP